jgi:hypothetical protein
MKEKVVELIRRFAPLKSPLGDWDLVFSPSGARKTWRQIDDEHRVLILADPGAGKTFEALAQARRIKGRGRKAFFIRIEALDAAFEQAFEVGDAEEFAAWLASNEDAWFFLDSVDEAQLETPRALETAIRLFGERIHAARERAHIFVTSRDDAWQALPDRTLVEQYLPYGESAAKREADTGRGRDPMLKLFRLTGLTHDEIGLFAGHYGVGDVPAFVAAVKRGNLLALAERPFDLKALIGKWSADQALGSRFEVLQRLIELQLAALSDRTAPVRIAPDRARMGARILAGAVMLTGKAIICLPDGAHSPDRLDPRALLPDWSEAELNTLLRTGVFDDIVYKSVRFRHREIRELLGAEWCQGLLAHPGGRARVEALFFRESYGERVIVPRTRPTLAWLILLDEGVRNRALALAPEVASEGGDPSRLPLAVRRSLLADIVERIATGQER